MSLKIHLYYASFPREIQKLGSIWSFDCYLIRFRLLPHSYSSAFLDQKFLAGIWYHHVQTPNERGIMRQTHPQDAFFDPIMHPQCLNFPSSFTYGCKLLCRFHDNAQRTVFQHPECPFPLTMPLTTSQFSQSTKSKPEWGQKCNRKCVQIVVQMDVHAIESDFRKRILENRYFNIPTFHYHIELTATTWILFGSNIFTCSTVK